MIRIIKFGLQNFWRNGLLSFASIIVITFTLIILYLFVLINFITGETINFVQNSLDLEVFFKADVEPAKILEIKETLERMPEVLNVIYISKEEALEIFKETDIFDPEIYLEEENPLPASLKIKVKDKEKIKEIAEFFQQEKIKPFIESTTFFPEIIERIIRTSKNIKLLVFALTLIFLLISLIVVFTTIRVTIFSRRREIEIMKLVGATSWFVRWPFIIEGILYGISATFVSAFLIFTGIKLFSGKLIEFFKEIIPSASFEFFFSEQLIQILILLGVVGVLIGALSSFLAISLSKYLRV